MNIQVLVIGAGPVGLTVAAELARYGIRVRIVEKNAGRTDKSKALVVWSRTLELLERSGCAAAFLNAGQRVEGANIFAGGERITYIDLTKIQSAYNFALMLAQSETERLLEVHLETLGVHVERQVEATSLVRTEDVVTVMLHKSDADAEMLEADWVIGCDGAHSFVRHQLGMQFEGQTLSSDWVLADVHVRGLPTPASQISTYWNKNGVLAIFPIAPGRFRIVADVGVSKTSGPIDPALEQVQAIVDERGPGGVTLSEPIWLSGFRINERKVARYRDGHAFLAGDAAHVHSPAGGQGMNTGMQDAFNLAWKLALVCRGTARAEPLLESYTVERSAVGEEVLSDAGRLTMVATLRNPALVAARNWLGHVLFGIPAVKEAMAQNFSETTIGYRDSPLNGHFAKTLPGPKPGERVTPVAGRAAFGAGPVPRFSLLADPGAEVSALIAANRELLSPELSPPPISGGIWLVRPDGYVACVATEMASIHRYLEALHQVS